MAGHQHEAALLGERDELLHLGARASPAASRRRRACPPRAPAGRARSGSAPGVAITTASSSGSASSSSKSSVTRAFGIARARTPRGGPRSASQSQRELGELVEVADEVLSPQSPSPAWPMPVPAHRASRPSALDPRPRRSRCGSRRRAAPRSTTSRVVDRRVRGDDHDAVVGPGLERRTEVEPVELGARAGRGTRPRRRPCRSSSISFTAGDSRMSPMSAL